MSIHPQDLMREGEGPPSTHFPKDTLRPSGRWFLNQFDFSNSVSHTVHPVGTATRRPLVARRAPQPHEETAPGSATTWSLSTTTSNSLSEALL